MPCACELDVAPPRAVTGFAVDGKRRVARHVVLRAGIELELDLAPVTLLTALEPLVASQNPSRGPIAARREGEGRADGDEAAVEAAGRVAEPPVVGAREVKREEPGRSVRELGKKGLRSAPCHETPTDHGRDAEL